MTDDELPAVIAETAIKAAVAVLVPYGGAAVVVYEAIRDRMAARGQRTLEEIIEQVGIERLADRLANSPEFEALTVNALDTALRSGLEAKRKLLSKVVTHAALDDAKVDEGHLIMAVLRDLDAPHLRCLQRLRLAVEAVAPEDGPSQQIQARNAAARAATNGDPEPVRAALLRTAVAIGPSGLSFGPPGSDIGDITHFGLRLLDELTE